VANLWQDLEPAANQFGALPFIYGTAVTAAIALVIAVPVSVGVAMLLTEVVPYRWARPIVYVIDLLAVVPSVVWGLWGILVFAPWIAKIYSSIGSAVTGVPVLGARFGPPISGASFFTAGFILAFMITPIVTSLSREVIATVPAIDKEGAYALGATRLEMITGAVWPHSKGGITGAVLLGLGRAMGETIAAALVIGSSAQITLHLFAPGYNMPAVIANQFGEASGEFRAALIGLGVLLFAFTIIINIIARAIVERRPAPEGCPMAVATEYRTPDLRGSRSGGGAQPHRHHADGDRDRARDHPLSSSVHGDRQGCVDLSWTFLTSPIRRRWRPRRRRSQPYSARSRSRVWRRS
jgi:phosphate transport system permease protein